MTGLLWLVLIGIAVTLLFTWLLLIDAVARGRPRGKMRQLAAAYRRFSPSAPQIGSECPARPQPKAAADTVGTSGARHTQRGLVGVLAVPIAGRMGGGAHLDSQSDAWRTIVERRSVTNC
jgi:hypothetical protein